MWLDLNISKYNKIIISSLYIFVLLSGIWNKTTNPSSFCGILQGPILGPVLFSPPFFTLSSSVVLKKKILYYCYLDLDGIHFCVLWENCNVRHEPEVEKTLNVHATCSQMGEDKQLRGQTNRKAADHWANWHQIVMETTKGGRRPEESKLFQINQETSQTEQRFCPSCYQPSSQSLAHFSDISTINNPKTMSFNYHRR